MFVERMPLLAGRTVLITVAPEDEKTVLVCVVPKKAKEDDHPTLTTPLSYTGTPEELDTELGEHLASYVECHTQLGSTLAQAKAAQEEACKKTAERNKKSAEKELIAASGASATPRQTVDGRRWPARSSETPRRPKLRERAEGASAAKQRRVKVLSAPARRAPSIAPPRFVELMAPRSG